MDNKDNVLIIGYGSIGRRHAKVLKELKKKSPLLDRVSTLSKKII